MMPRYYDKDKLKEMIEAKADTLIEGKEAFLFVAKWLDLLPPADVVPRAEVEDLRELNNNLLKAGQEEQKRAERFEYTLIGVMHSVDKWLDGEELEQDEVKRAITMREKTLGIIEGYQAQIRATIDFYEKREKEIFEEIEKIIDKRYNQHIFGCNDLDDEEHEAIINFSDDISGDIDELKKKHIEGGDQG